MSRPFSRHCAIELDRRTLIGVGAALVTSLAVRPATATPDLETAMRRFTGGAAIKAGKVTLDIAPLVENGNAVGVEVIVDHPMTKDNFVTSIALFTDKNPAPEVAVFHLSPRSGRAHVVTRMRLATTQHVTAVAQLSDGSFWHDTREVIVTIAACTEE